MNPSTTSSIASLGNIGRWAVAPPFTHEMTEIEILHLFRCSTHTHTHTDTHARAHTHTYTPTRMRTTLSRTRTTPLHKASIHGHAFLCTAYFLTDHSSSASFVFPAFPISFSHLFRASWKKLTCVFRVLWFFWSCNSLHGGLLVFALHYRLVLLPPPPPLLPVYHTSLSQLSLSSIYLSTFSINLSLPSFSVSTSLSQPANLSLSHVSLSAYQSTHLCEHTCINAAPSTHLCQLTSINAALSTSISVNSVWESAALPACLDCLSEPTLNHSEPMVCLSAYLSTYPIHQSIYLYPSSYLSMDLPVYASIYLHTYQSRSGILHSLASS